MSVLRSIAAVICGFFVITLLALAADFLLMRVAPASFTGTGGTQATAPLLFALVYSFFFSVAGGYVAALVAGRAEIQHAVFLAVLMLVMSILATVQMYETAPLWWHLATLVLIVPPIVAGGYWRAGGKRKYYSYSS